jgi:hypothetical protein
MYRAVALCFLAVKLVLLVVLRPFMDETYYWLWGQHPALSYFDHPALIGWTQGLASILGWNVFGLRAFVLLTLVGDTFLLAALARHRSGPGWQQPFWTSAAIFFAAPAGFALTNVALPDHLLVFFTLLTLYAFVRLHDAVAKGASGVRWLYLVGVSIGFATLTKYTGALIGVAALVTLLVAPRLRSVFRNPHFWLALLMAAAMQLPVLVWNAQNGFASFAFITGGRRPFGEFGLEGLTGYLLGILLCLSPFMIWPVIRFLMSRDDGLTFARIAVLVSTGGFLIASFFTNILIHWNLIAFVAALPFLHAFVRSRALIWGHLAFGALLAIFVTVNYSMVPVTSLISYADRTSAWSFGWEEVVEEIRRASAGQAPDFVAATRYDVASPLAFALADRDVVSFAGREAFDDWTDYEALRGKTAIIVTDRWRRLPDQVKAQFAEVTVLREFVVERFGKRVNSFTLYQGRDYQP